MIHLVSRPFEAVAVAGIISAIGYYAVCLGSAWSFLRSQESSEQKATVGFSTPPISILKPLKGVDRDIYQALRSHCLQEYTEYEIIFGVNDPNDPALEVVRRLKDEFPERAIEYVVCDKILGANTKVSNLAQMLPAARYDFLVVNDSDIYVSPDYLSRVVAPLNQADIGVVTCLYRGIAAPTLGSRLESLGISTDFCAGILVARFIEGTLRFGLGSTLAFRRRDLQTIGGFERFANYLADDYELASRIAALGLRVHLSDLVVQTFLPAYSLRDVVRHQLRWARGVRDCRPWGYAGLIFTFGVPWALLALLISGAAPWAWVLLFITLLSRLVTAVFVGRKVIRDGQVLRLLWLVPLRDVFALFTWILSFAGRTVTWRGDHFYLKDGKLVRIGAETSR